MAHFSAFFTAIFLLICALLIEQLAVAQSYGTLLGNDEPEEYEYYSPRAGRPRSGGRGASASQSGRPSGGGNAAGGEFNQDQTEENGDEDAFNDGSDDSGELHSGFGDMENDDAGDAGEDEDNMENSSEEMNDDPRMLDSERARKGTATQRARQMYRGRLAGRGGRQSNLRAHGQGYRLPDGAYSLNEAFNQRHRYQPSRLYHDDHDSSRKAKLPEIAEKYNDDDDDDEEDEEDENGENNRESGGSHDTTADSPSSYHQKDDSLQESSSNDYNDDKYSQSDKKAPDTIVT